MYIISGVTTLYQINNCSTLPWRKFLLLLSSFPKCLYFIVWSWVSIYSPLSIFTCPLLSTLLSSCSGKHADGSLWVYPSLGNTISYQTCCFLGPYSLCTPSSASIPEPWALDSGIEMWVYCLGLGTMDCLVLYILIDGAFL